MASDCIERPLLPARIIQIQSDDPLRPTLSKHTLLSGWVGAIVHFTSAAARLLESGLLTHGFGLRSRPVGVPLGVLSGFWPAAPRTRKIGYFVQSLWPFGASRGPVGKSLGT